MPNPPSSFENLQSVYRLTYNRKVREMFRDDIPDDSFSTPESQLKNAMLIQGNDSANIMLLRINLFRMYREEQQIPDVYGIPITSFDETVVYRPQVCLSFLEPLEEARTRNARQKRVRVSFRLMNETSETLTQSNITSLESGIRREFPDSYVFNTGLIKISYRDKPSGYELILNPSTVNEGKEMINQVLGIRNHVFNDDFMTVSQSPGRNYKAVPTQRILGESVRMPERRRITKVRLKRAELKIHGLAKDIILLERPFR